MHPRILHVPLKRYRLLKPGRRNAASWDIRAPNVCIAVATRGTDIIGSLGAFYRGPTARGIPRASVYELPLAKDVSRYAATRKSDDKSHLNPARDQKESRQVRFRFFRSSGTHPASRSTWTLNRESHGPAENILAKGLPFVRFLAATRLRVTR